MVRFLGVLNLQVQEVALIYAGPCPTHGEQFNFHVTHWFYVRMTALVEPPSQDLTQTRRAGNKDIFSIQYLQCEAF